MTLEQKIKEIKAGASPLNHRSLSVDVSGQLKERESLLDKRIVEGYGCIWGVINSYRERFHPGSWLTSIRENGPGSNAAYEIKFRDNHGKACSLFEILKEDNIGLYFRTKPLDDVSWADDLLKQLRSRTINNFSDGFQYIFDKGAMEWNEKDECIDIYNARLLEVSAAVIPSDMQTYAVRSIEELDILFDVTEDFIKTLERKNQLEARRLFSRHKSLIEMPIEQRNTSHEHRPVANGIDYNYLTQNF